MLDRETVSAMALSPAPQPKSKLVQTAGIGAAALLMAMLSSFEGLRTNPYRDVVGVPTVCYGETGVPMRSYTPQQCRDMLERRLVLYVQPVLNRNPELAGHDPQLAAASSLAYNIGTGAYAKSRTARLFSAGRWTEACNAFRSWTYAGGKYNKGLAIRREREIEVCLRGL